MEIDIILLFVENMLDKVDKTILAQLGKNARLSSQELKNSSRYWT